MQIWKRDKNGNEREVSLVNPGTTLGEMSLMNGPPRFATCITSMPVEFVVLDRGVFNRLLRTNPRLFAKFTVLLRQFMTLRLRDS